MASEHRSSAGARLVRDEAQASVRQRRSITGRAIEALALLVGFYVLVIVVAGLLIAAPILEFLFADTLHFALIALAGVGFALLWSLIPRREKWVEPGVRCDATSQPELWAAITRTAERSGQPVPRDAYLLNEVNAFVAKRNTIFGLGGRSV